MADKTVDDGQVFQAAELFKAVRDNKAERFFQIHDDLDEKLLNEPVIVRLEWQMALGVGDTPRIEAAAERLVRAYPDDPLQSTRLIEFYISSKRFERVIAEIDKLQRGLGLKDGATQSLKTSAAVALGNLEDAEAYALEATAAEPALELSWWSLLRARAAAGDYEGATEAMARLEDDFDERLDPQRLAKDPYLRVLADKQEYLDWRASRN